MFNIITWFISSTIWLHLCLETKSYSSLRIISIVVFLSSLIIETFWVAHYVINSPKLFGLLLSSLGA